jgi:hypothetical protein
MKQKIDAPQRFSRVFRICVIDACDVLAHPASQQSQTHWPTLTPSAEGSFDNNPAALQ